LRPRARTWPSEVWLARFPLGLTYVLNHGRQTVYAAATPQFAGSAIKRGPEFFKVLRSLRLLPQFGVSPRARDCPPKVRRPPGHPIAIGQRGDKGVRQSGGGRGRISEPIGIRPRPLGICARTVPPFRRSVITLKAPTYPFLTPEQSPICFLRFVCSRIVDL